MCHRRCQELIQWSMVAFALAACQARLYTPFDPEMLQRLRLVIQNPGPLRKNDCYPVNLDLRDSTGQQAATSSLPLTIALQSSAAGVVYASREGCEQYLTSEEASQFFLSAGSSRVSSFVKATQSGTLALAASLVGFPGSETQRNLGVGFTPFNPTLGPNAGAWALAFDAAAEKWYVGGTFTTYDNRTVPSVARLNLDGSLDPSFSAVGTGFNGAVLTLAVQADGKIVVGGAFSSYNGTSRTSVARLNTDGSLDTSFALAGTGLDGMVYSLALQGNGQVVIGGDFTLYNATARPRVARLNTDGTLDTGFVQTGTGLSGEVDALAIQADGRIIVGGVFTSYNGSARSRVARLNTNGTLDGTFTHTGTGLNNQVMAVTIQPDGRILVGGEFTQYNGTARNYAARLNSDGSLDTGFALTGTGLSNTVNTFAVQPDGAIVVGGGFINYNGTARTRVARLNSNGSLDTSFAPTGTGVGGNVFAAAVHSSGRVVLAGLFTSYDTIARLRILGLNTDGTLDTSFAQSALGFNEAVYTMVEQPDERMVISGLFDNFDLNPRPKVARIFRDGTLDPSFAATGTGLDGAVQASAIQSDGKIVVGGTFFFYNGIARTRVARLNSDGTLDSTFVQVGAGLNSGVNALALQSDGKVLVGGGFASYNGTARNRLARLNADGSLDTSFVLTGTGFNGSVVAIAIQGDGKVVVGGQFTSYNGIARSRVARLNSDGSLDTTFDQDGTGLNNQVYAMKQQSDGKVVVGGSFTAYNGVSRARLLRLLSNGKLDTDFVQIGTGFNNTVNTITLQKDGKVLAAGSFRNYNGVNAPLLIRLNTDGTIDPSFQIVGTGPSVAPTSIAVQSDGKVLVGGTFTSYSTYTAPYLIRLTSLGALD